jgi:hypothetical protein
MGLSLKPDHLRRYRDIAALFIKYGRSTCFSAPGSTPTRRTPSPETWSSSVRRSSKSVSSSPRAAIEGLQKVANRITLGLLIAAMIVGAAMLMRVESGPGDALLDARGVWRDVARHYDHQKRSATTFLTASRVDVQC